MQGLLVGKPIPFPGVDSSKFQLRNLRKKCAFGKWMFLTSQKKCIFFQETIMKTPCIQYGAFKRTPATQQKLATICRVDTSELVYLWNLHHFAPANKFKNTPRKNMKK